MESSVLGHWNPKIGRKALWTENLSGHHISCPNRIWSKPNGKISWRGLGRSHAWRDSTTTSKCPHRKHFLKMQRIQSLCSSSLEDANHLQSTAEDVAVRQVSSFQIWPLKKGTRGFLQTFSSMQVRHPWVLQFPKRVFVWYILSGEETQSPIYSENSLDKAQIRGPCW